MFTHTHTHTHTHPHQNNYASLGNFYVGDDPSSIWPQSHKDKGDLDVVLNKLVKPSKSTFWGNPVEVSCMHHSVYTTVAHFLKFSVFYFSIFLVHSQPNNCER